MITLTREEAQLVMDALGSCEEDWIPDGEWETRVDQYDHKLVAKALVTLRARLAEKEQEPVAKVRIHKTGGNAGISWSSAPVNDFDSLPLLQDGALLYTAPPKREWVGLTDEEIRNEAKNHVFDESFFSGAIWARGKMMGKNYD